ncbi:MAG: hypothetical protein JKY25_08195 [Robiginitomaculum sp.]|nr:hypothetical protein [Robiginitomaculum sp.]
MDDILHILGLLRQRAEADILLLSTQKANYLTKISDITIAMSDKAPAVLNTRDMYTFEKWRQNQVCKIRAIEKKMTDLDEDIAKAKTHFKSILTKNLSAKSVAKNMSHVKRLSAEEEETSAQLDVFLLQSNT